MPVHSIPSGPNWSWPPLCSGESCLTVKIGLADAGSAFSGSAAERRYSTMLSRKWPAAAEV
jgi:hypothetical protein